MTSTPPKSNSNFKVAIVGGGVCGLACAVALANAGISVDVYEAASAFSEVGAGIGLGPNAIRILREIGVLDILISTTAEKTLDNKWFVYRSGMEGHEEIYEYPLGHDDYVMSIHRASLLNALVGSIDSKITHFNKRCVGVSPSTSNPSQVVIQFEDKTFAEADIVVGADGIKSIVRGAVVGGNPADNIAYTNCVAYRGLVPMEQVKAAVLRIVSAPRNLLFQSFPQHLVTYPIKGGELMNIVGCSRDRSVPLGKAIPEPWTQRTTEQEILDEYQNWGEDVIRLLNRVQNPSKWMMHVVHPPLQTYVRGRIALLGDAAHAMLPHLSAGAGQGVEDAYVLSRLLIHPQTNLSNLEAVLQAYDNFRRPRVESVWDGSVAAGNSYEGHGKSGYSIEGVRKDLTGIWDGVWHHDLNQDVRAAVNYLEQNGAFVRVSL
ncbi:hypothetical protein C8Q75DRAFT_723504 [Abortiporus biennis]|nr:hypothetical protein C8Q75DRAFT_723504 [Abortiporus biennis]